MSATRGRSSPVVVAREHERVDHDPALRHAATSAQVSATDERGRGRTRSCRCRPVGCVSADGLPSVIMMIWRMPCAADRDAPRQPQPLARVRVVRPRRARAPSSASDLLRRVVDRTTFSASPGYCVLMSCASASATALGRRKPILPYRNHCVAAIEHEHRRREEL